MIWRKGIDAWKDGREDMATKNERPAVAEAADRRIGKKAFTRLSVIESHRCNGHQMRSHAEGWETLSQKSLPLTGAGS